jgi:hypothetical protein
MVRRKAESEENKTKRPPATTPEDRENQLISAAADLAEKQILAGTASSQVLTHFLKLGSTRERLEQEKLKSENSLLATKKEMMESEKRVESLIMDALEAMRAYTGNTPLTGDSDDEFED